MRKLGHECAYPDKEPDMVSLAELYGAVVALEKPFHMKDLLGAVKGLLGGQALEG